MRRLIPYLIIAALLAGSVVAYAQLATAERGGDQPAAKARGKSAHRLELSGHVDGLYPGAVTSMRVEIRNGSGRPVLLRSVRAIVGDAGPGCKSQNLWTRRFRGRRELQARSSVPVTVRIGMLATAPDACQGARFPLDFSARASWSR
jgi:hypothetical protein